MLSDVSHGSCVTSVLVFTVPPPPYLPQKTWIRTQSMPVLLSHVRAFAFRVVISRASLRQKMLFESFLPDLL